MDVQELEKKKVGVKYVKHKRDGRWWDSRWGYTKPHNHWCFIRRRRFNSRVYFQTKLDRKINGCRFAHTSNDKILVQLRTYLRGMPYDEVTFLSDFKVLDDIVLDLVQPLPDPLNEKYRRVSRRVRSVEVAKALCSAQA